MTKANCATAAAKGSSGTLLGLVAVVCFSFTLPATRVAVAELDSTVVGLGRALIAATLAVGLLAVRRVAWPTKVQVRSLLIVALGVVIGFPLLTALALVSVPSVHGAIVVGLLPLATTIAAVLRGDERPSRAFWTISVAGFVVVLFFGWTIGGGALQFADLLLVGAVIAGGVGYAEGGRLAREMAGWHVISWALVLAAPLVALPVGLAVAEHGLAGSGVAWLGFGYVSVVSMFLAFFAWYQAMAHGGIARVGQLQLLQPVLTLGWAVLLLGESVGLATIAAALAVTMTVVLGRRARVTSSSSGPQRG